MRACWAPITAERHPVTVVVGEAVTGRAFWGSVDLGARGGGIVEPFFDWSCCSSTWARSVQYALLAMSEVNECCALRCVCRVPLAQPTHPLGGGMPGLVGREGRSLLEEGGHPVPNHAPSRYHSLPPGPSYPVDCIRRHLALRLHQHHPARPNQNHLANSPYTPYASRHTPSTPTTPSTINTTSSNTVTPAREGRRLPPLGSRHIRASVYLWKRARTIPLCLREHSQWCVMPPTSCLLMSTRPSPGSARGKSTWGGGTVPYLVEGEIDHAAPGRIEKLRVGRQFGRDALGRMPRTAQRARARSPCLSLPRLPRITHRNCAPLIALGLGGRRST